MENDEEIRKVLLYRDNARFNLRRTLKRIEWAQEAKTSYMLEIQALQRELYGLGYTGS